MLVGERLSPRFPGALIGLALAAVVVVVFGLEGRGVATLGAIEGTTLRLGWPQVALADLPQIAPLAIIVALVVMVQTAATTRSFVSDPAVGPDVGRDFVGLGAANLLAGFLGAFPLNASPPRTAIVAETGGASQLGALVCAGLALALAAFGGGLLAHVPHAALAGVLLFVAQRIFRVRTMIDVWRRSRAEFALVVATMLALLVLPIQQGVAIGVILSLLHGVWTTTRARLVEFERIPGTSIWWPASALQHGERAPGVRVVGLQAPLSFLNAYGIQAEIQAFGKADVRLLVIEANAVSEIDYTGATVLAALVSRLRAEGVDVAFARLESVRAQQSFARQGLEALVGRDHLFHSVEEAVQALRPAASRAEAGVIVRSPRAGMLGGGRRRSCGMSKGRAIAALAALLAAAAPAAGQEAAKPGLDRIGHIIVLYLENRSFDQLYGQFPGADGLAEAGAAAPQVDRDGKPYDKLPPALDTNRKGAPADARFPAAPDNGPFRADALVSSARRPATWCTASIRSNCRSTAARWTSSSPGRTPARW